MKYEDGELDELPLPGDYAGFSQTRSFFSNSLKPNEIKTLCFLRSPVP
jgi:hypothetical protein